MATYIGFNTQNINQTRQPQNTGTGYGTGSLVTPYYQPKKYKLTDAKLVIQDLTNALNIKQGDLPGNPSYGTTIWSYVFEPGTPDTIASVENEVRRVASADPRLLLNTVTTTFQDNGLLIQLEMSVAPFNVAFTSSIFLNSNNGVASQV